MRVATCFTSPTPSSCYVARMHPFITGASCDIGTAEPKMKSRKSVRGEIIKFILRWMSCVLADLGWSDLLVVATLMVYILLWVPVTQKVGFHSTSLTRRA